MRDGIADYAVNSSGNVHLLNAIDVAQLLGGDLTRSGFLASTRGCEGEHAPRPYPQHSADDPLLAHAHADHGMTVAFPSEELDHGDVVRQDGRDALAFVAIRREGQHF